MRRCLPSVLSAVSSSAHGYAPAPSSAWKHAAPALLTCTAAQRRFGSASHYETEGVEILALKRGDYIVVEGELGRVHNRNTKKMGRATVQGYGTAIMVTGPRKGQPQDMRGMSFRRATPTKLKLLFDAIDEEKDEIVLRYYKTAEMELERMEETVSLTVEAFDELVLDTVAAPKDGAIRWLLPEMPLSVLLVENDVIEIKFPQNWGYTVKNLSQVAGNWMVLVEENDMQVQVPTANCTVGDTIMVGLPKGNFLKFEKADS